MASEFNKDETESIDNIKTLLHEISLIKTKMVRSQKYEDAAQMRDREKKLLKRLEELEGNSDLDSIYSNEINKITFLEFRDEMFRRFKKLKDNQCSNHLEFNQLGKGKMYDLFINESLFLKHYKDFPNEILIQVLDLIEQVGKKVGMYIEKPQ